MPKKSVDSRLTTLLSTSSLTNQRSLIVLVGDKGKQRVPDLWWMREKLKKNEKEKGSVLWMYGKGLGFTTHAKKRMKETKNKLKRGLIEPDEENPFELFIASNQIEYCYYKESERILGRTYAMCILQDFEALTPNLLARTIETVEGGGIVLILLKTMTSLKQLYTMTMEVHSRYRTESQHDIVPRFNERFILSLGSCSNALIVDDELNILPTSLTKKSLDTNNSVESSDDLKSIIESLDNVQPLTTLASIARTRDQAKSILTFVEAIADKTLSSTVALTAGRGRGKSAALGIAVAAAISYGYTNIFVTSPHPDNLKTLFEFVGKTFKALGYEERVDYDFISGSEEGLRNTTVRVNVHKEQRQTIQYIHPTEAALLGQAELLVIDEAAAIPLPLVKAMLGPYLVLMASTIHGYEGTGRALSIKLFDQLRTRAAEGSADGTTKSNHAFREIKLIEPIRYSKGDKVEQWLNLLLCYDVSTSAENIAGCPHPNDCELFKVERDTLFSFHDVSEAFLQKMMSLYVSSHYKNSPNDLLLMSDAPGHELFVLLPPISSDATELPEPLVVIQTAYEGSLSKKSVIAGLKRGKSSSGDMIPWTVLEQFQEDEFASMAGARTVRIATHPNYTSMGYGQRAIEQLTDFFTGKFGGETKPEDVKNPMDVDEDPSDDTLHRENLKPKDLKKLKPLLYKLTEISAPSLAWLGVAFGHTESLARFWRKSGFTPIYLKQDKNDLTGEHTCIMLQSLVKTDTWLKEFDLDFRRRFAILLSRSFRDMPSKVAAALLDHTYGTTQSSRADLISPQDLRRLRSYTSGVSDYYGVLDIATILAQEYFRFHTWELKLTSVQNIILVAVGLQQKTVKDISTELQAPHSQIMSLFQRCLKQFSDAIYAGEVATIQKQDEEELAGHTHANTAARNVADATEWDPLAVGMTEELMEAGQQASAQLCAEQKELLDSVLDSAEFDVDQGLEGWKSVKLPKTKGGLVSIKTGKALKKADNGLVEKLAKEEEAARNKKIESGIRKKARKDKAKIKA